MGVLPEHLDIELAKNVTHQIRVTTVDELKSDHNPVLMHIGNEANEPEVIRHAKIDWTKFTEDISENVGNIPRILTEDDLEQAVDWLESTITDSVENATTRFTEPTKRHTVPQHIVELIRAKNRARRTAHRTGWPIDRREANCLQFEVKQALSVFRNEQWEQKFESLNSEDNSIWKIAKILRNTRKPLPPIHGAGGIVYTDHEKAEAFADSLELQCRASLANADPDHIDEMLEEAPDLLIQPASPQEVSETIRSLKNRKAPGPDNIANKALKTLPEKAIVAITAIATGIIRLRHFPARWKTANVIFIPKPGKNPKFLQNHRPISLLSTVGKLVEKLIHSRLTKLIDDNRTIPDELFGLRAHHSTTDQLLRVTEYASVSHERTHVTAAVFLDVAKAFDTVWHNGLVFKLRQSGVPVAMAQLIYSCLEERSFRAKIRDTSSTPHPIEAGVPQGSVLSPLLYSVFTADIPKTTRTTLAMYADDTAIITRSKQPRTATGYLQEAVDALEDWFRLWRIDVNRSHLGLTFIPHIKHVEAQTKMVDFHH
jgi:hypothetical protein